jgi:hypothetical protein
VFYQMIIFIFVLLRADISFSKTGGNEYTKLYSQKSNLELEISTHQKNLEGLILRKNSASDAGSRNQTVEEILRVHADLQTSISQYNQILKDLTYRFPEKGNESKRQYAPMKNRTIDQIEKEMGIDASLSAIKEKIDKKYAPFQGPDTRLSGAGEAGAKRTPSSHRKEGIQKEERIRLVK